MASLDTRQALYGEKRLSDPQVRALRHAARQRGIPYGSLGWGVDGELVTQQTVLALRRAHLVDVIKECVVATPRGHSVLRMIDETADAPAPDITRSA